MLGGGRVAYAVAVLALSAFLADCGTVASGSGTGGVPVAQTPRQPSIAEQQQAIGAPVSAGYEVSIAKIGMRSSLVELGRNADGSIQVPALDRVEQAGVYRDGPMPGEVGPSALLCHVNGAGRPGCGARFAELREGDIVDVTTPQGPVQFEIYRVNTVAKNQFPTRDFWSDTEGPELRLATCGGSFDSTDRNYLSNVLIWARKV